MGAGYTEALQAFAHCNPEAYDRVRTAQALDLRLRVRVGDQEAVFWAPNEMTLYRIMNLPELEPETISWIGGMDADSVLVDIGANVGIYTIWAACTRGIRVFAFEPESQSYSVLCRNVVINGLDNLVTAYCAAVSNTAGLDALFLSQFEAGFSSHQLGQSVDALLQPAVLPHRQGCVSVVLDEAVAAGSLPPPTHVKIDVDGIEHKVIAGMQRTLAMPQLRSVLIEINRDLSQSEQVVEHLCQLGFTYDDDQVKASFQEHRSGNYIFRRA
jgi:FkbM family methyltransferase